MRRARVPGSARAFTLVEILVAMAVFVLLLAIVGAVMTQSGKAMRSASAKLDAFAAARSAFDVLTQKLSETTLNTYWDYDSPTTPTKYLRKSDLHFLVQANGGNGQAIYFQAPQGVSAVAAYNQTQGALNACACFVSFGSDAPSAATPGAWHRPDNVAVDRYRYRLMYAIQPTENLKVMTVGDGSWTDAVRQAAWPIADNVIALVVWPRLAQADDAAGTLLTADYQYDSRTTGTGSQARNQAAQLPPTVQVTMVVIDEASAVRLANGAAPPAKLVRALTDKFNDVTKYDADMASLETALNDAGINYQVRNGTVTLRESKWSLTQ